MDKVSDPIELHKAMDEALEAAQRKVRALNGRRAVRAAEESRQRFLFKPATDKAGNRLIDRDERMRPRPRHPDDSPPSHMTEATLRMLTNHKIRRAFGPMKIVVRTLRLHPFSGKEGEAKALVKRLARRHRQAIRALASTPCTAAYAELREIRRQRVIRTGAELRRPRHKAPRRKVSP